MKENILISGNTPLTHERYSFVTSPGHGPINFFAGIAFEISQAKQDHSSISSSIKLSLIHLFSLYINCILLFLLFTFQIACVRMFLCYFSIIELLSQ